MLTAKIMWFPAAAAVNTTVPLQCSPCQSPVQWHLQLPSRSSATPPFSQSELRQPTPANSSLAVVVVVGLSVVVVVGWRLLGLVVVATAAFFTVVVGAAAFFRVVVVVGWVEDMVVPVPVHSLPVPASVQQG